MVIPCGSTGKESSCNAGDLGSVPGLGTFPGEGKGYPLQCSGLENSTGCIVHGVTKSWTRLSDFHIHNWSLGGSHSTCHSKCSHIPCNPDYRPPGLLCKPKIYTGTVHHIYKNVTSLVSHQSTCISACECIPKYLPSPIHVSGLVLGAGARDPEVTLDDSGR